jgi:hypothetical protein
LPASSADLEPVDVEGVYVAPDELDRLAYTVRDLPRELAELVRQAYRHGYRDAIRAREPFGAEWFGNVAHNFAYERLSAATRGWTVDEREEPWRLR